MTMEMAVGIVGTGNMGGAMWRRLHDRNVDAEVFDLRRDVAAQLGARVADSASALVAQCDAVILSLPTSRHVQAAIDSVIDDLVSIGCEILTLGQYLQPTANHLPVIRWVHPDEFASWT